MLPLSVSIIILSLLSSSSASKIGLTISKTGLTLAKVLEISEAELAAALKEPNEAVKAINELTSILFLEAMT